MDPRLASKKKEKEKKSKTVPSSKEFSPIIIIDCDPFKILLADKLKKLYELYKNYDLDDVY